MEMQGSNNEKIWYLGEKQSINELKIHILSLSDFLCK